MEEPTKKPRLIKSLADGVFDACTDYTPNDFRELANTLETLGIESLSVEGNEYYGIEVYKHKLETTQQAEIRYGVELRQWFKIQLRKEITG